MAKCPGCTTLIDASSPPRLEIASGAAPHGGDPAFRKTHWVVLVCCPSCDAVLGTVLTPH